MRIEVSNINQFIQYLQEIMPNNCAKSSQKSFKIERVVRCLCQIIQHYFLLILFKSRDLAILSLNTVLQFFLFFLSERCCVHNMSPFVSSSGLSPGSREAKVQRTKVCLNCTEPSVARSSCWSLPVRRYLSETRYKGLMVVPTR